MEPILSVIVPVYNVERYIHNCIDSILNQTFTNFELILVDDGSTDKSGLICDGYGQIDKRIIVVHKKNGGQSSARNLGLKIAKGKYITFVDSDDEIVPCTYEENLKILFGDKTIDAVQYPAIYGYKSNREFIRKPKFNILINHKELLKYWWNNKVIDYSLWNKIFKKEIFNSIVFPEGKIFEDFYIITDLAKVINCFCLSVVGEYRYYIRENSTLTSTNNTLKKMTDHYDAYLKLYMSLYKNRLFMPNETILCYTNLFKQYMYIKTKGSITCNSKILKEKLPLDIIYKSSLPLKRKMFLFMIKLLGVNLFIFLYLRISKL